MVVSQATPVRGKRGGLWNLESNDNNDRKDGTSIERDKETDHVRHSAMHIILYRA